MLVASQVPSLARVSARTSPTSPGLRGAVSCCWRTLSNQPASQFWAPTAAADATRRQRWHANCVEEERQLGVRRWSSSLSCAQGRLLAKRVRATCWAHTMDRVPHGTLAVPRTVRSITYSGSHLALHTQQHEHLMRAKALTTLMNCPPAEAQAAKYYQQASEAGDAEASYQLGMCYQTGSGVPKNPAAAVKEYTKAAGYGHLEAQKSLVYCYSLGFGVAVDQATAARFARAAAEQGDAQMLFETAERFANGNGYPKVYTKGKFEPCKSDLAMCRIRRKPRSSTH